MAVAGIPCCGHHAQWWLLSQLWLLILAVVNDNCYSCCYCCGHCIAVTFVCYLWSFVCCSFCDCQIWNDVDNNQEQEPMVIEMRGQCWWGWKVDGNGEERSMAMVFAVGVIAWCGHCFPLLQSLLCLLWWLFIVVLAVIVCYGHVCLLFAVFCLLWLLSLSHLGMCHCMLFPAVKSSSFPTVKTSSFPILIGRWRMRLITIKRRSQWWSKAEVDVGDEGWWWWRWEVHGNGNGRKQHTMTWLQAQQPQQPTTMKNDWNKKQQHIYDEKPMTTNNPNKQSNHSS